MLPLQRSRFVIKDHFANLLLLFFWACLATTNSSVALGLQTATSPKPPSLETLKLSGAKNSIYLKKRDSSRDRRSLSANLKQYKEVVKPILQSKCADCHGPDNQEGDIRIDTLDPDLLTGKDVDWWLEVRAVLSNGEMPPPDEDAYKLSGTDRGKVVDWLSNEILAASQFRRASAYHSTFRRMTRYEFNYALQDLLGLPWDFAKDLPPDPNSEDGFQNSSEMLHMSSKQLDVYRRLARKALRRATVTGERPRVLYWNVTMDDAGKVDWKKADDQLAKKRKEFKNDPAKLQREINKLIARSKKGHSKTYFKDQRNGRTVPATWSYGKAKYSVAPSSKRKPIPQKFDRVAIIPEGRSQRLTIEMGDKIPNEGNLRIRVRASKLAKEKNKVPSLQVNFGFQASNEGKAETRVSSHDHLVTATPDNPQIYQWDIPLGDIYPRNDVRGRSRLGQMPNPSEYIRLVNGSVRQGAIQIDYVEIMTPFYDQWPPESHKKIFIQSTPQNDERRYAAELFKAFMTRAWRRPITKEEVDRKLKLFDEMRPLCDNFEEAVVEVLATALASPNFLFLVNEKHSVSYQQNNSSDREKKNTAERLSSSELGTRLSMFLWCSLPDDELLRLVESDSLKQPEVLAQQVQRMLADPKANRLAKHFVEQWLDMQLLEFLSFKKNFRSFDPSLKESMQKEPVAFFAELLKTDASVLDFLHSDYAMVDERLSIHYGLPLVQGNHMQRISLRGHEKRGGILAQAGLLAMNSSGVDSHPLKRGVWLLESILNDPPPPPPPAVPEIDLADPKIAKMTLKERIENHRNHAACRSCHSKIDPWGIAFENYDAIGRFREKVNGKPVDASSKLFNDQELAGLDGLKRYLLKERQDQFVAAMAHKLATFALGRPMTFADQSELDKITANVRKKGDGLATLIHEIIQSELFNSH